MAAYIERRRNGRQVMRLGGFEYELWYEDLPPDIAEKAPSTSKNYWTIFGETPARVVDDGELDRLISALNALPTPEEVECQHGVKPARLCMLCQSPTFASGWIE